MVVIHKNWQPLPVAATTVTAPDLNQQPTTPGSESLARRDGPIQQPTAHLIFEPDIVELNKINQDKPNESAANTYQNSSCTPLVWPKKRSRIIEK